MTKTPPSFSMPKVALVTGAAKRIGRAIALDLGKAGFAVAIHHNNSMSEADSAAAEIRAGGGVAATFNADFMNEAETASLIARVVREFGPIGLLVNNASRFEVDDFAGATRESWDSNIETNLRAPFVLTQAFAAQLPDDAGGSIVNLIDQRVWNLTPYFATYTVSKAGLWALTQTSAMAFAPRIRVNAIGPGPVLPSPRQSQEQFERQCAAMPLKRGATTAEIARAIRFILETPSMTGQMIALDGGQHLGWAQSSKGLIVEE
jgi:NAD(P)-dependent dehydrogenase (short-subunit alcohol dehydrogenase family)